MFLKYAVLPVLAIAIGSYGYWSLELEHAAPVVAKGESAVALVAPLVPAGSASVDEERDYVVARRLGSVAGWQAFLAAHENSVYSPFAKAENARLLPEKVSNGASPNANVSSAAAEPALLSPGKEVAVTPPPAAEVASGATRDPKAVAEAARPVPPSAATGVMAFAPEEVCKRDIDRLARLLSSPTRDEAARFANELGCEELRPQLQRLLENLRDTVPAPAAAEVPNGAFPDAEAAREAVGPAPAVEKTDAANASSPVAVDAAARPPAQTSAPQENAGRGVTNKAAHEAVRAAPPSPRPDAAAPPPEQASAPQENAGRGVTNKAAHEAARPAPPSARPDAANAASVVAAEAAAPPPAQTSAPQENAVRGVTDKEIVFGMAAPFSGASKELGRQMKIGVETAFSQINDAGGVNGRLLRLVSADDGYEPTRTSEAMQVLYDKDQVFGFIGNVGTPTAAVALPFALDHRALFFGAFTGASLLRRDPPDRYVFNYRASYAEETNEVVHYLVKVRRIKPKEIVVFAQNDSYGDSGYAGVEKAVRSLPGDNPEIIRLNYKRNTVDVQQAVDALRAFKGQIKAVVMVAAYRAAAKFIEKTRDLYPSLIYTNVSFVGSTALADELMLLGPRYATGVIVTQVTPAIYSHASIVLKYKGALAKYFSGEAPDYVSFEGYIDGTILAEALKRVGRDINTEKLVDELERMHDFDLGLGTEVTFNMNEHQGSHKVWGTQLDEAGHYQPIDLQ